MRHGRAKAARRTLQFFHRTHGFASPYHVILDGNFLVAICRFHIPLLERLGTLLQQSPFHLYVTQSTLDELQQLQNQVQDENKKGFFDEAYRFAIDNATVITEKQENDEDEEKDTRKNYSKVPTQRGGREANRNRDDGDDHHHHEVTRTTSMSVARQDLLTLVQEASTVRSAEPSSSSSSSSTTVSDKKNNNNNRMKYFLASQDEELLDRVRRMGCVPVIRLAHNSVLLLEQPSRAAHQLATRLERQKWNASILVTEPERQLVQLVKDHHREKKQTTNSHKTNHTFSTNPNQNTATRHGHKKAKGPNPLSCRKKKADDRPKKEDGDRPNKRRRRHK